MSRGPRSALAQPAMVELEQACILCSKASLCSIRATKALVRLPLRRSFNLEVLMCLKAILPLANLMKKHGMRLLLLNVIHRPSCPAMVVYYGTLRKMIQTMNSLFRLAHNEALEIILHRANTTLVPYFLLLVNFLNINRIML